MDNNSDINSNSDSTTAEQLRTIILPGLSSVLVVQILGAALRQLGYQEIHQDHDLLRITARLHDTERSASYIYQYEYSVRMSWKPYSETIDLLVSVSESAGTWQANECERRVDEIFEAVAKAAEDLSESIEYRTKSTVHGDAQFATKKDAMQSGLLSNGKQGRLLMGALEQDVISIAEKQSHRHVLICGPTGSGKTWSLYIPNLIERTNLSMLVTESKAGDEPAHLFTATAGYRESKGHKIFYFDPNDLSSTRINPVDMATDPLKANQMASLIMENTSLRTHMGDQIWETSERLLLLALLLNAHSKGEHLGHIRWLLREGAERISEVLSNSPSDLARKEGSAFINNTLEGYRNGVVSGLQQRLNLWIIPEVVALTERTDINWENLRDKLFTFYLVTPGTRLEMQPLMALVFNFLLTQLLEIQQRKYPLALMLDEFINFGRIPGMTRKLTLVRHAEIATVLGVQDFLQLCDLYGDTQARILFSQPATRIFFKPNDYRTAEEISKLLGKTTIEEHTVSARAESNKRTFGDWLMSPDKVLSMPESKMIVRTSQSRFPLLLDRLPIHEYRELSQVKPTPRETHPITPAHAGTNWEPLPTSPSNAPKTDSWQERRKQPEKQQTERTAETGSIEERRPERKKYRFGDRSENSDP
jgi:type IV secretion system protein VirD4